MELRKDYILDKYVIISQSRGKRPSEFNEPQQSTPQDTSACFFCPGNEHTTPPAIGQIGDPWRIRWFENKYSFLKPEGPYDIETDNNYFTFAAAYGDHQVIVETPDHALQLTDLSESALQELIGVYQERIRALSVQSHIKYVHIFKNHGKEAGTSIHHAHTQVAALNHIPHALQEKLDAIRRYDHCPYCDILHVEKQSDRRCFENDYFVAFTPYASRFSYEIVLLPKSHIASITQLNDAQRSSLAQLIKIILGKLKTLGCAYNMFIHNTPESMLGAHGSVQDGADGVRSLHFQIIFCPRIAIWAGLEIGAEIIVNAVSPEEAAQYYRAEK